MSDPKKNPNQPDRGKEKKSQDRASVEEEVKERVSQAKTQARKEEVLEIYEDLLKTIWDRILPTLGRVTVIAIVERALVLTKERYPSIAHLEVTSNGVSFEVLPQRLGEEERMLLREALKELIANPIDILAMLTGDILVRQLLKEIEGRKLL